MRVDVQQYNPEWLHQFQRIKEELEAVLLPLNFHQSIEFRERGYDMIPRFRSDSYEYTSMIYINKGDTGISLHVGSTSVPGLCAKPIIDIIIITSMSNLQTVIEAVTSSGDYTHMGERGIPGRHALKHHPGTHPQRNLYVCIENMSSLKNPIAVRDICRNRPDVRGKYGSVKMSLAAQEWESIDAYCDAKSEVLTWILSEAGMSDEEIDHIREYNEEANKPKSGASAS